ncbi:MAG: mechanosensitive ion channel family protein [Proteobacteria bacterium]|nr:mechanosensitive ion channel family protein [Pseudomonadota bacterium]
MPDFFNEFNQVIGNYAGITAASYIAAIAILVVFFILAQITNFIFNKVFKVLVSKTKTNFDDDMMKILNAPIFYTVVFLGVYQSLTYINVFSQHSDDLWKIIKSVMIILWAYSISNLASLFISELGGRFAEKTKSTLDNELMPLFRKLSRVIIYFGSLMLLFGMWNIDITPFLASAGIAGFVIAFAAQDTISHLFGGISIYFDKPFRVGDRIQLESGEIGDVLEIGIRSTRIKTFDETVIIIPNSKIASSKIINYNQPEAKIKQKVEIAAAYGSDIDKVKKVLLDIANSIEEVEKNPAPSVYLNELGDYGLKFLVIMWVDNPHKSYKVKTAMNEEIYKRFKKERIEIPYPTQEVIIKK